MFSTSILDILLHYHFPLSLLQTLRFEQRLTACLCKRGTVLLNRLSQLGISNRIRKVDNSHEVFHKYCVMRHNCDPLGMNRRLVTEFEKEDNY